MDPFTSAFGAATARPRCARRPTTARRATAGTFRASFRARERRRFGELDRNAGGGIRSLPNSLLPVFHRRCQTPFSPQLCALRPFPSKAVAALNRPIRISVKSRLMKAKGQVRLARMRPPMTQGVVQLLRPEKERALIAGRTKSALAAARAKGVRLGNPNIEAAQGQAVAAIKGQADRAAGNVLPIIAEIRRSGATTLRAIAEALNARGVPTPRGGRWHAASVKNALARA